MSMFDGILDSVKGMINDSLSGVETRAHQFIASEEQELMRALRTGLIGTSGYALLMHRFAPKYEVLSVFLAPLLYLTTAKTIAGREGYVLGVGVGSQFF